MNDFFEKNKIIIGNNGDNNYFHVDEEVLPSEIPIQQMKAKTKLAPIIWNTKGELNPKIRMKLLDISDSFWNELNLKWVDRKDTILTGSICNYNWNDFSDIDLHILIDYKDVNENVELVKELLDLKKLQWSDEHINLKIYNHLVEVYVQDINSPHYSNGIFSLEKNNWLKKPSNISNLSIDNNKDYIQSTTAFYINLIDEFFNKFHCIKNDNYQIRMLYKKINKLINKLHLFRKQGLCEGGEMSPKNIIYKLLRSKGYISKLYDLKFLLFDYLNSIK